MEVAGIVIFILVVAGLFGLVTLYSKKVYFAGGGELKAGAKAKFDALIKSGKAEYLGFVSKMDEIYAACNYVLGFSYCYT